MCRTDFDFYGMRDFLSKFEDFGSAKAWAWLCLDVTDACNHDCLYCCAASPIEETQTLSFSEVRLIVDQAAELGLKQLSLLGGEPLLHPDILQIIQYAVKRGVIVHLCSNGSLINWSMAEKLIDAGATQVQVNLDHIIPEFHDQIRGRPGSYDATRQAIDCLLQAGMPTLIATVVLPLNRAVIADLFSLSQELGVQGYRVWDCIPCRYSRAQAPLAIAPLEYRALLLDLITTAAELGVALVRSGEPLLATMPDVTTTMLYTPCPAGTLMYAIDASGQVHACTLDRERTAGNVKRQPLAEILDSQAWASIVTESIPPVGCKGCSFLDSCRSGCKARIDDGFGRDSKCWHPVTQGSERLSEAQTLSPYSRSATTTCRFPETFLEDRELASHIP